MDSITHIAVGACLGEAFAGRTVGRKTILWGILAQSIPDADFIAAPWLDTTTNLLFHRGFSHSILFTIIAAFGLGLLAEKLHRPHNISRIKWISFFACSIGLHLLLDSFNNYGVGLFEPFNHTRISFNCIYVLDPIFSVWPAIAFSMLLVSPRKHQGRGFWWKFGLAGISLYMGFSLLNKWQITHQLKSILATQHVPQDKFLSTPAPFQNLLWFVASGNDSGFHVGYRSVFDTGYLPLSYFPRNESMLAEYSNDQDVKKLKIFSQGYYTISKVKDTLIFNDLRFGQVIGWMNPAEKFAFHYYINFPKENKLVVQRGRFEKLSCVSVTEYWSRMLGEKE